MADSAAVDSAADSAAEDSAEGSAAEDSAEGSAAEDTARFGSFATATHRARTDTFYTRCKLARRRLRNRNQNPISIAYQRG